MHPALNRLLSFLVFHALLTIAVPVHAEETRLPRFSVDDNATTYVDKAAGFTVNLPKNFLFSGQLDDLLVFRSPRVKGTLIVQPRPGLSLRSVQQVLRNGLRGDGVLIKTTGSPETLELGNARALLMEATGTIQGKDVYGLLAGVFGENEQGYLVLVGSVQDRWTGFEFLANSILDSFRVIPSQPGFEHERWESRLRGLRLLILTNPAPIATEQYGSEYHFCADGRFYSRWASSQATNTGFGRYAASTGDNSKGTWRVAIDGANVNVILQERNRRRVLRLGLAGDEITLNGATYGEAENQMCP